MSMNVSEPTKQAFAELLPTSDQEQLLRQISKSLKKESTVLSPQVPTCLRTDSHSLLHPDLISKLAATVTGSTAAETKEKEESKKKKKHSKKEESDSSSSDSDSEDSEDESDDSDSDDSDSDSSSDGGAPAKKGRGMVGKCICGWQKPTISNQTVKKTVVKWGPTTQGAMAIVEKKMKTGIFHVEFQMKNVSGRGWSPVFGICSLPFSHPQTYCWGDSQSISYYNSGYLCMRSNMHGLDSWSGGDQIGMEVDLRAKYSAHPEKRTIVFFINGKVQNGGCTNVWQEIQFGVGVGDPNCEIRIVCMKKLKKPSFKKSAVTRWQSV